LTELRVYNNIKITLGHAKRRLMGEQAVEQLYDGWSDELEVMSADIDFFDPLDLLRVKAAVEKVTEGHDGTNVTATPYKTPGCGVGVHSAFSHHRLPRRRPFKLAMCMPATRRRQPGLDIPASGKRYFRNLKKTGRFPKNRDACVLCGKGEEPGSQGHRSDMCNAAATDAEIDNWVEHGIWAK
jgi:hypothetical protein